MLFFAAAFIGCNNNEAPRASKTPDLAETPPKKKHQAEIQFENDTYNFGVIREGKKLTHKFRFVNIGDKPLIITNASASCGCTIPEYPHKPVPPGQSGEIKVVFNSGGKMGMQNKVITINSNAAPSGTELYIVGEVENPDSRMM